MISDFFLGLGVLFLAPDTTKLAGTNWKVDACPFEDPKRTEYALSEYDLADYGRTWGHFLYFDETTFSSHYSAPCGNDCFTSVYGDYSVEGEYLKVKVEKISRHGFCEKPDDEIRNQKLTYTISVSTDGIKLTRAD